MPRLYIRSGLEPGAPEAPVAVLVIDPDGTPGERALNRYGALGHESAEAFYLLQTDGWAEHSRTGDRLALDIAVYPAGLEMVGVDPADFPVRSAIDPRAVLILHAETAIDPTVTGRLSDGTAVFTAAADTPPGDVLASEEDLPLVLAPPPDQGA